ncbi:hypothetical protein PT974_07312 [Cladobotryum mycophilum]|uniref:Uncharacterized protein n=1 Tax=Cladobotryum mycophilum TaxID=491253 RepID=A0ABR0SQ80_9HYPO
MSLFVVGKIGTFGSESDSASDFGSSHLSHGRNHIELVHRFYVQLAESHPDALCRCDDIPNEDSLLVTPLHIRLVTAFDVYPHDARCLIVSRATGHRTGCS